MNAQTEEKWEKRTDRCLTCALIKCQKGDRSKTIKGLNEIKKDKREERREKELSKGKNIL